MVNMYISNIRGVETGGGGVISDKFPADFQENSGNSQGIKK
jgi:hypothetical protein